MLPNDSDPPFPPPLTWTARDRSVGCGSGAPRALPPTVDPMPVVEEGQVVGATSSKGVRGRQWRVSLLIAATIVALGGCGSSAARKNTAVPTASPPQTISGLTYADRSPLQQLDLYLPRPAARPAPLVIWIHGGGWRVGDKNAITEANDTLLPVPKPTGCADVVQVQTPNLVTLTAMGYAVAAVNYRLNQNPVAAVQDAKAAVRFLRVNARRYHLDPSRFAAWGDSAGGYSAIMLGLTGGPHSVFDDPTLGNPHASSTVQAVIDWFGPTDSSSMPTPFSPAEDPFAYISTHRRLSPFMIANGSADCVVPPREARHLYTALTNTGAVASLAILPGAE